MNQGEHNGFNVCGWFVCFSVDSGTRANPVNPVILSKNLYAYDALGEAVVSARDINLDGQIDNAGPDVVSSNATAYVQLGSAWWRESRQYAFPDTGSAAPLLVSTSRQRLSGLGGSESTVIGTAALVSESVSIDALGNTSTRKSYLNRDAHATASVSTTPSSTLPAYSITVGGLSLTNCTSAGIVSSREYDALGRTIASTDGRGNTTTLSYDAHGRVAWSEDALGNRTTLGYDALGRQVAVTNALGQATHTAYDAENRVISTWGATYPVAYAYDAFGRMTAMNTFRDESMQNGDTTTWLYDEPTGLLTNKVYADGKGPSYTYTSDGKLATRTWARGIATAYAYNAAGQLTGVDYSDTTPDVAYTYDRLGRQKVAQTFLSAHHYAYDPATLAMVSETIIDLQAGTSNVITRATDSLGRSTGFSLSPLPLGEGQGEGAAPYSVTYGYDTYGRFAQVSNFQFQASYSYLSGSDLVSGMTASSGHSWSRSYEPERSLITAVENKYGSEVISRFDYENDAIGRRTAISRSGTAFDVPVRDAYGYNARSEVTSARRSLVNDANQEVRGFSCDYAYDPIGNRTSSTEYDHEDNDRESLYAANALNQYTQRTVPGYAGVRGSATNTATVTVNGNAAWRLGEYFFGGDDADNASSAIMKELETLAVINPPETNMPDIVQAETGRIFVPETPEAFTHDDDGNLTQDGRFTYTWDGENRLIAVETRADLPASVPRVRVTYQYDPRSRRIGKQSYTWATDHWTLTTSNSFTYDGWNLIQELAHTQTHTLTNFYTWGLDLSGSLQGAGGVGGLLAVIKDSATYVPAYDANGNIMEYVVEDGTIAAHYEYSPFGETIIQSGPLADAFNFRFSTKFCESEAKLYYYGYRFYVPESGRWLNRDPIGVVGGVNLMGFSRNAGITFVDFLGMICEGEIWYDISFDNVNPYTLEPQQPLPPPDPHPYVPDTSDGFSFSEAVFAYYFGQGNDVTVPFSVIDQGYGIGDFSGFDPCSYPVGAHEIEPVNKLHDMLSWKTLDQGGPGRIVFELNGSMTMDSYGKWSFSGTVSARADRFNFDPKDRFGERDGKPSWQQQLLEVLISGPKNCLSLRDRRYRFITYPKESITRLVHDLDQNTPLKGQEFDVNIVGNRSITAEGCCEK